MSPDDVLATGRVRELAILAQQRALSDELRAIRRDDSGESERERSKQVIPEQQITLRVSPRMLAKLLGRPPRDIITQIWWDHLRKEVVLEVTSPARMEEQEVANVNS